MSQETVFQYGDYTFSINSFTKRTCRLGDNSEKQPNGIPDYYPQNISIPSQVWYEDRLFYVTEIGKNALCCQNCVNTQKIFIPYTVEIIRTWGASRLIYCEEIQFEPGSHLQIIEEFGLYDLYRLKTINFASNCLKELKETSMRFAKLVLEQLIIPSSVETIARLSLGGMPQLKDFYYCGQYKIEGTEIFVSGMDDTVTPSSLNIHVLSTYKYDYIGERSVTHRDADEYCQPFESYCSLYHQITCPKSSNIHIHILFVMFFL